MSLTAKNIIHDSPSKRIKKPSTRGLFDGLGFRDKKTFLEKEFEFLIKRKKTISITFKYFLYKMSCEKLFRSEHVLLLDKANNTL